MSMLKPDSRFPFGKYKGRQVIEICEENPSYLCWLRQTGFSDFGKEITEFIFDWEEENPTETANIKRKVERSKKEEAAKKAELVIEAKEKSFADDGDVPLHNPVPAPVIPKEARPDWGSW